MHLHSAIEPLSSAVEKCLQTFLKGVYTFHSSRLLCVVCRDFRSAFSIFWFERLLLFHILANQEWCCIVGASEAISRDLGANEHAAQGINAICWVFRCESKALPKGWNWWEEDGSVRMLRCFFSYSRREENETLLNSLSIAVRWLVQMRSQKCVRQHLIAIRYEWVRALCVWVCVRLDSRRTFVLSLAVYVASCARNQYAKQTREIKHNKNKSTHQFL